MTKIDDWWWCTSHAHIDRETTHGQRKYGVSWVHNNFVKTIECCSLAPIHAFLLLFLNQVCFLLELLTKASSILIADCCCYPTGMRSGLSYSNSRNKLGLFISIFYSWVLLYLLSDTSERSTLNHGKSSMYSFGGYDQLNVQVKTSV